MGRISGLTISGTVKERRRRQVPLDNPKHEIVTYSLIDEYNTLYFVDDFQPDKYYESVSPSCCPSTLRHTSSATVNPPTPSAHVRTFKPAAKSSNLRAHPFRGRYFFRCSLSVLSSWPVAVKLASHQRVSFYIALSEVYCSILFLPWQVPSIVELYFPWCRFCQILYSFSHSK